MASLFILGYPSSLGGANTELWHTIKLWRRFGVQVTLVPTWHADPDWRVCLDALGCRTIESTPDDLQNVPGLKGGTVVSMCNTRFLTVAGRLRELGCRIVWLGSMNWLFPEERLAYRKLGPFDVHVFQSRYQRDQLAPQLRRFGWRDEQGVVIHGALDVDEFPWHPRPRRRRARLLLGRLSRPAADKFPRDLWRQYAQIQTQLWCRRAARASRRRACLHVRVLGWNSDLALRCGDPPSWAECLPPCHEPASRFLHTLHAVAPGLHAAAENWPRFALEAMASGVPLVLEKSGGVIEMIEHGETGFLCESVEEMAENVARLADSDGLRMRVAVAARAAVRRLADPATLWKQWREIVQ